MSPGVERGAAERHLQVFSDLGLKLSSSQTAVEAASVIAACADDLWRWDACTVDLYRADADRVDPLVVTEVIEGARRQVLPQRPGMPPTPIQRRVLEEGGQLLLRDGPVLAAGSLAVGETPRLSASLMIVPIRHGASVVGFISVQSDTANAYDRQDLESLQALADFCGGAIARIRAFEDLRASEQKLREAQAIGRIGSWEWNPADGSLTCSEGIASFLGLDPQTFRPTFVALMKRVLPEDRTVLLKEGRSALEEHRSFEEVARVRRADGEVAVVQLRGEAVLDEAGEPIRMIGVAQDITRQHRVDERLRRSNKELQLLSARLGTIREEESSRIARAVHDEVGQALTALKLDLAWIQKRLLGPAEKRAEAAETKLAEMLRLVDATLDAVHRISTELRPSVLHELGLEAAVRWHAREFERRTDVLCRIHSDLEGAPVDDARSTAAFRIFQEILTNVARHAAATEVDVVLRIDGGTLALDARDNGRGIPEEKISDSRCLGLLGMRERARSFGGNVTIKRDPEGGTAVSMRIPL